MDKHTTSSVQLKVHRVGSWISGSRIKRRISIDLTERDSILGEAVIPVLYHGAQDVQTFGLVCHGSIIFELKAISKWGGDGSSPQLFASNGVPQGLLLLNSGHKVLKSEGLSCESNRHRPKPNPNLWNL